MASLTVEPRNDFLEVVDQCPFFGGDISNWSALQPTEQAEVILAAYQERVLPELDRIERLLTHLAVEYGLEYCRLEELAVFFLDVTREIRSHVQTLEFSVGAPANNEALRDLAADHAGLSELIVRLHEITGSCAANSQVPLGYTKLLTGLRTCQLELADLLILEAELSGMLV